MLEHADAGHLVVDALAFQIPVVLQFDADSVLKSRGGNALASDIQLALAQGHTACMHAVMLCRMQHESAPAAAYVQEFLAGPQRQLAADMVEFRLLGGVEAGARVLEISAGVDHGPIQ